MAPTVTIELAEAEIGYILDALSDLANLMPEPEIGEDPLDDDERQERDTVFALRLRLQDAHEAF